MERGWRKGTGGDGSRRRGAGVERDCGVKKTMTTSTV
jgi:hypothetical protein